MTTAVVGAGFSGAILAVLLAKAGREVTVFDKGRGAGGRLATRRHESGISVDHGCPGISMPPGDPLTKVLETVIGEEHVARWDGLGEPMAVGVPGMSRIVRTLLGPLPVTTSFEVARAHRNVDGWHLSSVTGETAGPFEALFITVPAPQVIPIVEADAPHVAEVAARASYRPQWTVMAAFESDAAGTLTHLPPRALAGEGVEVAIHDGGKPGRGGAMTLVCHMDEDWSRANLERERPDVAGELAPRFAAALGLASPGVVMAHRWRYARVAESAAPVAFDPDLALGVAGDWTVGPSVGDAFISAVRCAEAASRASATAS